MDVTQHQSVFLIHIFERERVAMSGVGKTFQTPTLFSLQVPQKVPWDFYPSEVSKFNLPHSNTLLSEK